MLNQYLPTGFEDSLVIMKLFGIEGNTQYYFIVYPEFDYAPVDYTVFAEGSALSPITGTNDEDVKDLSSQLTIDRIYPSPASDHVRLEFYAEEQSTYIVSVADLLGNVIMRKTISVKPGINQSPLFIDQLTPGIYFAVIENNGLRSTAKKFVKQ